jgi:hypothetical protein
MENKLKGSIRNLVASAKTDQAIEQFLNWANTNNGDLANNLVLLKGQYSNLKRQESLGMVSFSEAGIRRSQISNSVLELLNDAQSNNGSIITPPPPTNRTIVPNEQDSSPTPAGIKTILFMGANPPNTRFLQLEVEHSRIAQRVGNKFNLATSKFTSASDIPELISRHNPNIIHFSGHGKDPVSGEQGETAGTTRGIGPAMPKDYEKRGGIVVFDDDMRAMTIIEDDSLDYLFESTVNDLNVPLEVVVFNSCHSESQAKVIGRHIAYVVGSSRALEDDLALAFAEGFYFAMAEGKPIERAFVTGKQKVVLKKPKARDLIVLYKNGEKTDL